MTSEYYAELINEIKSKKLSKAEIVKLKIKLCSKHKFKTVPTDIQVLLTANEKDVPLLRKYLLTKPTRSISGVSMVAIMSRPYACPHGKCTTCPGGPESNFGDVPQSYTGKEPATMRALRANFDPYIQTFNRLEQYVVTGHIPEKIELIIMGGTFISFPKKYRDNFVTYSLKAMNDFSKLFLKDGKLNIIKFKEFFYLPGDVGNENRAKMIFSKLRKLRGTSTLELEQKRNEKSEVKCVGMTIETRPDYAQLKHANEMLRLGCTRVELGVQSVYNKALKAINRGHTVEDSIHAIKTLRDLGYKLNFHMMLGLPTISEKEDLTSLKQLFTDNNFKPDMLKLYPCMVLKGTKLFNHYKKGKFIPITTQKAANLIAEFKRFVEPYCRIMRVQRDIPTFMTEDGVDRTNLRQYIHKVLLEKGYKCRCIRCREVGRALITSKPELVIREYDANQGKEFFISFEDKKNDVIFGFCRLRIPSQALRSEITSSSTLVRELHVYGSTVALGKKAKSHQSQHRGLGKKLLDTAEKITKQHGKDKVVVISGIGVRDYYRKQGYRLQGPYMVKSLK
jgi:elongator complex protein 3